MEELTFGDGNLLGRFFHVGVVSEFLVNGGKLPKYEQPLYNPKSSTPRFTSNEGLIKCQGPLRFELYIPILWLLV